MSFSTNPSLYLSQDFNLPREKDQYLDTIIRRENFTGYVVNRKQNGLYDLVETQAGQYFFTAGNNVVKRPSYRTVIDWGALPNAAAVAVAHNITGVTAWTNIYGAARGNRIGAPFPGFPLPYVHLTLNNQIQVDVDDTNVTITTAINYSDYDGIIVLEYLKE